MAVVRIDPSDRRSLRRFVALDRTLWGHEPCHWSGPDSDLARRLRGKSAFNVDIDHALFERVDDEGRYVGRVVGYINRRWQRESGEAAGFVGNLAFAPGTTEDGAADLLGTAEDWLRSQQATHSICGIDGSGILGYGVLSAEHDASPMFPFAWHPPSYPDLLEAAGYAVERRFWTYRVRFDNERYREASRRALDGARCSVRPVNRGRWKAEIALIARLFNKILAHEWEMNAVSEAEIFETSGQFRPIVDPRTWLFAEVNNEPAGFCLGMPDLVPLFRSFRGGMGPIQAFRLLRGARNVERHGLVMVGIRDQFRQRGIGQTLACTLYRYYEQRGLTSALYYVVDDENLASRCLAESLGADGQIQFHCYRKAL